MTMIRFEHTGSLVTLIFDDEAAAVNTMNDAWLGEFAAALDRIEAARGSVTGIILTSAKSTFFAGADLKAVEELIKGTPAQTFAQAERIKVQLRRLEKLGLPVVALIAGSALGGGLEIALAAHHRICLDNAKIQLGLPEVSLGLLPAGGGLTKMVRLLGLITALPYLLEGKLMAPKDAAAIGLVTLASTPGEMREQAEAWIAANPQATQPWDKKGYKIPGGGPVSPAVAQALAIGPAMLRQKTRGLYPAPEAIMACAVEGAQVDFDTALRLESRQFAHLVNGPVAKSLIGVFFDRTALKAGASRPPAPAPWRAKKVGVIGAGLMGAGIAYANAARGIECVLKDTTIDRAEAGKQYSKKATDKRVTRGAMDAAKQAALLDAIKPTADLSDLAGCDLIIEAVFENRDLKASVTRETEGYLNETGFYASNTSTLPITGLAQAAADPKKFIGLHFFSPVDKMELVEIIVGHETSDETLAHACDYVLQIGKLPIIVNDARGFYTSRTFGTYVMEGATMLGEGIPAPVIEQAALLAGMPVGPLAVADEASMAIPVHILDQLRADYAAEGKTYEASAGELFLEKMVKEFGRPGRAGGGGYYDYPEGGKKTFWPELKTLFEKPDAVWTLEELRDRFLYRQSLETLRCFAEGVLRSGRDANIGSIFGIGFPAWTGGTWHFIEAQGLTAFTSRCNELAARYGDRFLPPALPAGWQPGQHLDHAA